MGSSNNSTCEPIRNKPKSYETGTVVRGTLNLSNLSHLHGEVGASVGTLGTTRKSSMDLGSQKFRLGPWSKANQIQLINS